MSDPGNGKNLNRAREPGQQCLSAKLLDVSAILGQWRDDSTHRHTSRPVRNQSHVHTPVCVCV